MAFISSFFDLNFCWSIIYYECVGVGVGVYAWNTSFYWTAYAHFPDVHFCIYIYIYVYMYKHIYVCTCMKTHLGWRCVYMRIHNHVQAYIHTYICVSKGGPKVHSPSRRTFISENMDNFRDSQKLFIYVYTQARAEAL